MDNKAFINGFIKRAQECGCTKTQAIKLAELQQAGNIGSGADTGGSGLGGGMSGGQGPSANPLGLGSGVTPNPSFNSRGLMNLGNQPFLHNGAPYSLTNGAVKWPNFLRSMLGSSPGLVQQMQQAQ